MKENYCHIVGIIDCSGSMVGLENDVIGGFNKFVDDQRKAKGTATMSLIQFDDGYYSDFEFVNINDVPDLNRDTYIPRGMTALYDAIGKTINSTGEVLKNMNENDRPDRVVVFIQTDGQENSSLEYNANSIKQMINKQEEMYNWSFVFLGANINAKSTANIIGIDKKMSMTFAANSKGTTSAFNSVSENLSAVRCGTKLNMCYESKDYSAQADAGLHI